MTDKMKKLLHDHSEILADVFEDVIEPILLEQQKITFMQEGACEKQLKGFALAFRTLENVALKGKDKKNKAAQKKQ